MLISRTDWTGPRTVVVTGANGGIGLAATTELARRGYAVVATVRDQTKADRVQSHLAARDLRADTVVLDVRDADAPARIADREVYGLVNNAGFSAFGAIEDVADDVVQDMVATMLVAPMRLTRAVLPGMIVRGEGRIVNVSSIFSFTKIPFNGWYQAVKHGLEAATDALRNEVAGAGIAVTSIEPGAVTTALWEDHNQVLERFSSSRHVLRYRRSITFMKMYGRLMTSPERVADVIGRVMDAGEPKRRYVVGADAHVIQAMTTLIPKSAQDLLTRRVLGL